MDTIINQEFDILNYKNNKLLFLLGGKDLEMLTKLLAISDDVEYNYKLVDTITLDTLFVF